MVHKTHKTELTLLIVSDLGGNGEAVNNLSVQTFAGNSTFGTATTELHTVSKNYTQTIFIPFVNYVF